MSVEQDKDIAHRFIDEIVNGQRFEAMPELTGPDYQVHFPGVPHPLSAMEQSRLVADLHSAFPDLYASMEDMIAESGRVAVSFTLTGTNTGAYQGMEPTGRRIKIAGMVFYTLSGGKIVDDHPLFDRLELLEQLGVMQPQMAAARSR